MSALSVEFCSRRCRQWLRICGPNLELSQPFLVPELKPVSGPGEPKALYSRGLAIPFEWA